MRMSPSPFKGCCVAPAAMRSENARLKRKRRFRIAPYLWLHVVLASLSDVERITGSSVRRDALVTKETAFAVNIRPVTAQHRDIQAWGGFSKATNLYESTAFTGDKAADGPIAVRFTISYVFCATAMCWLIPPCRLLQVYRRAIGICLQDVSYSRLLCDTTSAKH